MLPRSIFSAAVLAFAMLATSLVNPTPVSAHCDSVNGPVVKAAQAALAAGNVDLVLVWVQPGDEKEIREAFARTHRVPGGRRRGPGVGRFLVLRDSRASPSEWRGRPVYRVEGTGV